MKHVVKLQLRKDVATQRLKYFCYCCILIEKLLL
jgi:hypothetical protein